MTADVRVARSSWLHFRVVEERQVTGPRFFDARDSMDIDLCRRLRGDNRVALQSR